MARLAMCKTKTWNRPLALLFLGIVVAAASGCGSDVSMKGNVTFDNQPIEGGTVTFVPVNPGGSTIKVGALINNGTFEIPGNKGLQAGTYKVEIFWPKKTGKKLKSAEPPYLVDQTKQVIPVKYNRQTTLEVVLAQGLNTKDFSLSTR